MPRSHHMAFRALCFSVLCATQLPLQSRAQTPSFQGLGQMPGATSGGTYCNGVSGDGSTIIGYAWVSGSATRPYRWTAGGGYEDLVSLGGENSSNNRAYGVSLDGSVVVGQSSLVDGSIRGFRWTASQAMRELPFYEAMATSTFGTVIVGSDKRWTDPGQVDTLGYLGGNNSTYASGVSLSGQVVVGYSETSPSRYMHAFRWTPAGGLQDLGVTNGTESLAWGVSPNGVLVFGEARDPVGFWRAFRWTSALGMRDMGTLGGPMSTAHGASLNGEVIVGKSLITSSSGSLRAFRWTSATGMRDLRQELLNAGVTAVQNWTLAVAAGVSQDGRVIVGWGYPGPLTPAQPFRAVLPATVTAVEGEVALGDWALRVTPNPSAGSAGQVTFRIPRMAGSGKHDTRLTLHSIDGRLIRMLHAGLSEPGAVVITSWDGRDNVGRVAASGVYFLQLSSDGQRTASARLVVLH